METAILEIIKANKQQLIEQLYADLANTAEADRFYSTRNIEICAVDLDNYIDRLLQNPDSKHIEDSIKWIFESLSTFGQEEEDPEFLWGFIYNGYTKELTRFILETAFAFGLEKGKPETILADIIYLKHNPHSMDWFRVYIGSTPENGVLLDYNIRTAGFEYLVNPYGESYALPVFDLTINEDQTALSFNVLAAGTYSSITLKAGQSTGSILFKAIHSLHNNEQLSHDPPPDFCSLELELNKGMLTRLSTMNYDPENRIINMFTEGTGIKVFAQELDADGCFQSSDNMASHPEIVDEKFVIVDAVPNWKYYEIEDLIMQDNTISVRTKSQRFEYANVERNKVIAHETTARTIHYPVRSYCFIQTLLGALLQERKTFISRFQ